MMRVSRLLSRLLGYIKLELTMCRVCIDEDLSLLSATLGNRDNVAIATALAAAAERSNDAHFRNESKGQR